MRVVISNVSRVGIVWVYGRLFLGGRLRWETGRRAAERWIGRLGNTWRRWEGFGRGVTWHGSVHHDNS